MSSDYFQFLRETRENYVRQSNGNRRQDAYKFGEFLEMATPIERNVWSDCRLWGLEMYPQFPVGKYYLDFANPFFKIAIEADGQFHKQQREKDASRDAELEKAGWKIFRVEGWSTYKKHYDYFREGEEHDERTIDIYERNTSESLVRELAYKCRNQDTVEDTKIVTTEEIIRQIEADQPRRERQRFLNEYLFDYEIPAINISYRAT